MLMIGNGAQKHEGFLSSPPGQLFVLLCLASQLRSTGLRSLPQLFSITWRQIKVHDILSHCHRHGERRRTLEEVSPTMGLSPCTGRVQIMFK